MQQYSGDDASHEQPTHHLRTGSKRQRSEMNDPEPSDDGIDDADDFDQPGSVKKEKKDKKLVFLSRSVLKCVR